MVEGVYKLKRQQQVTLLIHVYSIPTRRELVKEAKRDPTTTELKETQHEKQGYYWTYDPISRKPLVRPVVSDSNGKLYNKDTILEYLLSPEDGSTKAEAELILQGSVKSLKDVVELKFEVNEPTAGDKETWKCPITSDTLGPGSKAVYLVPCGHVFSPSAIKEISGEKCPQCNESYASNDVIPIIPTATEDIARLSLRMKTLKEKGLAHSLKKVSKDKKRKKRDEKEETAPELVNTNEAKSKNSTPKTSTPTTVEKEDNASNGIHNASTASLTAKVLAEQEQRKKRKMENENVRSLFSSRDQAKPHGKSSDFMTRGFSIPANAKR